ncbi:hypothetical protein Pmani_025402 [Petrolisthes manimaculis]|uniref:Uncharacterized protein n=1 Tax=Petrolisthes manimaculis TaxID=1843537 RepID=A0AAE1U177_9EUCA|nr:hypothetical protein Pmani_025402 [Petrolisthes manimaculis]
MRVGGRKEAVSERGIWLVPRLSLQVLIQPHHYHHPRHSRELTNITLGPAHTTTCSSLCNTKECKEARQRDLCTAVSQLETKQFQHDRVGSLGPEPDPHIYHLLGFLQPSGMQQLIQRSLGEHT